MFRWESEVEKRSKVEIEIISKIMDLKIIKPKIFLDDRGFFCENYNKKEWENELNFFETFKQDNHSFSKFGVVRGLHAQPGMGKLVSVVFGKIFDVAVDIRLGSSTFGKWHGVFLDAKSKNMFWLPDGFLHGFQCVSEEGAHVIYKCNDVYNSKTEFGINPFDPKINIIWPITDKEKIITSIRDQQHPNLDSVELKKIFI